MSDKPKTIQIGSFNIELEPEGFGGIKYWAVHYKMVKPRYEVFVYIGQDRAKQLYVFQSRTNSTILYKSLKGLELSMKERSFKPFLLETKKLTTLFDWD